MSELLVIEKLDSIKDAIAELKTDVALNNLAYENLNAELQEHKKDGKWKPKG